jgi:hypothetical protein
MRGEAGVHSLKSRALICSLVSDAAAARRRSRISAQGGLPSACKPASQSGGGAPLEWKTLSTPKDCHPAVHEQELHYHLKAVNICVPL